MTKIILKAEKRDLIGSKVRKLRKNGQIPAIVFGKTVESAPITVNTVQFNKVYKQAGETHVIWLKVDGEGSDRPTLIKSLSVGPVKGDVQHIDFHQVNLKEKVTAFVPLVVTGESETINSGTAILSQNLHEVEVECLPTEIPEKYELDISGLLEVGASLSVSDLSAKEGVTVLTDPESIILSLSEPQKEEEPLETEVKDVEVIGEEETKEGEEAKTEEAPKAE